MRIFRGPASPAVTSDFESDPVTAYDRISSVFVRVEESRRAYLEAIDRLVIDSISWPATSMIDVGSGNGARALRIAREVGILHLVMVEPSEGMRRSVSAGAKILAVKAECLGAEDGRFDVVTCLWNVLGHIFPASARVEALRQFARLTAPRGRIFLDVSHRYNARHYGVMATACRMIRDHVFPDETNGDVTVTWNLEGARSATAGHVFTHREIVQLCHSANLEIERKLVVDYESGQLCRRDYMGHLLYQLRPLK